MGSMIPQLRGVWHALPEYPRLFPVAFSMNARENIFVQQKNTLDSRNFSLIKKNKKKKTLRLKLHI